MSVQDLGLGNMERCRGFSSHLFKLLLRQRRRLAKITEHFMDLRYSPRQTLDKKTCNGIHICIAIGLFIRIAQSGVDCFFDRRNLIDAVQDVRSQTALGENEKSSLPPQESLGSWVVKARTLAQQCCAALQQLSWVVHCCPEGSSTMLCQSSEGGQGEATLSYPTPLPAHLQPQACLMRRGEAAWTEAVKSIEALQSESAQLKERLNALGRECTQTVINTRLDS